MRGTSHHITTDKTSAVRDNKVNTERFVEVKEAESIPDLFKFFLDQSGPLLLVSMR